MKDMTSKEVKISIAIIAIIVIGILIGSALNPRCPNCGKRVSKKDAIYDQIAGKYVCETCYFDNAFDMMDQFMEWDMIEDYLDSKGYEMVKK